MEISQISLIWSHLSMFLLKKIKLHILKAQKKHIWSPHLALGRFHTRPPKSLQSTTSMFDSQFVFSFTRLMSQPEFGLRSGYPIFHLLNPSTQSVLRCHVPCIRHCRTQSTLESWQNDAQKMNKNVISVGINHSTFPQKELAKTTLNRQLPSITSTKTTATWIMYSRRTPHRPFQCCRQHQWLYAHGPCDLWWWGNGNLVCHTEMARQISKIKMPWPPDILEFGTSSSRIPRFVPCPLCKMCISSLRGVGFSGGEVNQFEGLKL